MSRAFSFAALCAGFTLGLTAPAWADYNAGLAAYKQGDYATAVGEWRPLAKQGHAHAQSILGVMYRKGQGVPQDDAESVRWSRKAAEQGIAGAQRNLGVMYSQGRGVSRDYVQGYMWTDLAASSYPPGEKRDAAVKNRELVAKWMTRAQISEAQKLAREWKPKK